MFWSSHKARGPVKSIGAAEKLAAGEAIDIDKVIRCLYERVISVKINLVIAVDSKDLYTTLTTQRQSIDKSIRGDVGVIRYKFENQAVSQFIWNPGSLNPADIGTKFDSQLNMAVVQILQSLMIPFNFERPNHAHQTCTSAKTTVIRKENEYENQRYIRLLHLNCYCL